MTEPLRGVTRSGNKIRISVPEFCASEHMPVTAMIGIQIKGNICDITILPDEETEQDESGCEKTGKPESKDLPDKPQQEFPLPETPNADVEMMLNTIKTGFHEKRIPKDYLSEMVSRHSVAKLSELSTELIRDMFVRIMETNEIYHLVDKNGISPDKPIEFAQKFGKSSVFELTAENRNQMYDFLCQMAPN